MPWWQRSAKLRKKSTACSAEVWSSRPSDRAVLGHLFQAVEHLLDNAMFAAEDFGGFHRRLLEKCLSVRSTESYPLGSDGALIWIKPLENAPRIVQTEVAIASTNRNEWSTKSRLPSTRPATGKWTI